MGGRRGLNWSKGEDDLVKQTIQTNPTWNADKLIKALETHLTRSSGSIRSRIKKLRYEGPKSQKRTRLDYIEGLFKQRKELKRKMDRIEDTIRSIMVRGD